MTSDTYRQALQKAEGDLATAIHNRDRWTIEVARLEQLANSLRAAFAMNLAVENVQMVGIQDLVLSCVRTSGRGATATEINARLKSLGYDPHKYANNLAVIHGALKRLEAGGYIYENKIEKGRYFAIFRSGDA